jgi:hypothetical protein
MKIGDGRCGAKAEIELDVDDIIQLSYSGLTECGVRAVCSQFEMNPDETNTLALRTVGV